MTGKRFDITKVKELSMLQPWLNQYIVGLAFDRPEVNSD